MIMIGIALYEEIEMRKKYGEEYIDYYEKTPYMIPLPKLLSNIITAPSRLIIKGLPRSKRDIAIVLTVYTIILIALSFILINVFNL